MSQKAESSFASCLVRKNRILLSKVRLVSKFMSESKTNSFHSVTPTFRLFPVGDPHRADTVGLRG